ncbi:MAG: HEAT repeat domain-containing protein [Mangrovibacterium sp.]
MKRKHLITVLGLGLIWVLILASSIYGLMNAIENFTPEKLAIEQAKVETKWVEQQKVLDDKNLNIPFGHQVKALKPVSGEVAVRVCHFVRYFLIGLIDFYIPEHMAPAFKSSVENIIGVPLLTIMLLLTLLFNSVLPIIGSLLFIITFRKEYKIEYKEKLSNQYEERMMEYLFGDLSAKDVALEMRKVKSKLGKDILIENLMNYERNLSGEYADRILLLYRLIGLHRFSIQKIKSRHTDRRVSGIRELSNLYPTGAISIIQNYVNDKNHLVRSEAQIAYAFLDHTASYHFLDNLEQEFSTWTQLNILNYVKLHEQAVPSFQKWLDSPNNDVQDFCIRMIQYFQQAESASDLSTMVYHQNRHTREQIYKAIRALEYTEAKDILIGRYFDEVSHNKLEILRTINVIGNADNIDFLLLALSEENSVEAILLICQILIGYGSSGEQALRNYAEERDQDMFKYINYVTLKDSAA